VANEVWPVGCRWVPGTWANWEGCRMNKLLLIAGGSALIYAVLALVMGV
jgi:hypothetical protein